MDSNPGISLFQGASINVENALQNMEEAEDLEDQKRRQEEIQSLLTKAMDEFNYDDQSTINSSTNVSINDTYEQKYRNASMDDQVKVLYEVRVREVKSLTEQLEGLKEEMKLQKDAMMKKLMLAEADKERAQISLRQSQELLVTRTGEISKLQDNLECMEKSMKQMKDTVEALQLERESLKHSNNDLIEQLTIMQKGLGTNTVSDRQLQENYRTELSKLQHNLENALTKLERKEKENKNLEQKLSEKVHEKDELMVEKCEVINRLTESLEDAQQQCRELLQLVETLNQENIKLKQNAANYDLANTLKSGLSDKVEIIKVLQKELEKAHDQHSRHLLEFEKLQLKYSELHKNFNAAENHVKQLTDETKALNQTMEMMDEKVKLQNEENRSLNEKLNKLSSVQSENEILQKSIQTLQDLLNNVGKKNTTEQSAQVSQIMTSFCEQNELHKEEKKCLEIQLEETKKEVNGLKAELAQYEEIIKDLKTKVRLENEREELIQSLQEKAMHFEKVILESQQKVDCNTIGINTDAIDESKSVGNFDILKAQFETKLLEKEIQIRMQVEQDFEAKLNKLIDETPKPKSCGNCSKLVVQLKQLESMLKRRMEELETLKSQNLKSKVPCAECAQLSALLEKNKTTLNAQNASIDGLKERQCEDRIFITKILEEWKGKFEVLEKQNFDLTTQLQAKWEECKEWEMKLQLRDAGDAKLTEDIKRETANLARQWNKHEKEEIKKIAILHRNKILESRQRVDNISKSTDKKIKEIESKYKKSRRALETAMS